MRRLILGAITVAALCAPRLVVADPTTPPPVVVPHDDTTGIPADIKTLITSFDQTRDTYLAAQLTLLAQLKGATTAADREQIRDELQSNREAYLAELKTFRTQLKDDLIALKGKITHEELLRIIDAAHNATGEGGLHHHKGQ